MTPARPRLAVDLEGVRLPTPVMVASGCFGTARELSGLVDPRKLGGIVTRSVTLLPLRGVATPRMAETASGLLSATGLQNPGVEAFAGELGGLLKLGIPVFVSIAGERMEEYMRVAVMLRGSPGIAGLELNLSCPDADNDGRVFALHPNAAADVCAAVSRAGGVPVFAKLTSEAADVVEVARACVAAGAHGITLINTVPAMAVDVGTGRAKLAAVSGGLSGPAIHPIAVHAVFRVARAMPDTPVIGVGGVTTANDALEFLTAGAWAVQVGTAMFTNPRAPVDVALGIAKHLAAEGMPGPEALRTRLRLAPAAEARA